MKIEEICRKLKNIEDSKVLDRPEFKVKVDPKAYIGPLGVFFVTSEQLKPYGGKPYEKAYSVRQFNTTTGAILVVYPFNSHTKSEAHRLASKYAREGVNGNTIVSKPGMA